MENSRLPGTKAPGGAPGFTIGSSYLATHGGPSMSMSWQDPRPRRKMTKDDAAECVLGPHDLELQRPGDVVELVQLHAGRAARRPLIDLELEWLAALARRRAAEALEECRRDGSVGGARGDGQLAT
eukprot:7388842-Prymnesium_polylepis.1